MKIKEGVRSRESGVRSRESRGVHFDTLAATFGVPPSGGLFEFSSFSSAL
jgi:hypothetical protein